MIGYTHRYDSLYPYNNRRCGCISSEWTKYYHGESMYWFGTTSGASSCYYGSTNGEPFCPQRHSLIGTAGWCAICDNASRTDYPDSWIKNGSCPKGWGGHQYYHPNDYYSVQSAQGYIADNKTPIYSTVTKYRDTVYNYTAGRIAKA